MSQAPFPLFFALFVAETELATFRESLAILLKA